MSFLGKMTPTKSFLTLKFRLAKKVKTTRSLKTKPGRNIENVMSREMPRASPGL